MKTYICNAQILASPKFIAHFGDTLELDENDAYTKTLEAKKFIYPAKTEQTKTKKQK